MVVCQWYQFYLALVLLDKLYQPFVQNSDYQYKVRHLNIETLNFTVT